MILKHHDENKWVDVRNPITFDRKYICVKGLKKLFDIRHVPLEKIRIELSNKCHGKEYSLPILGFESPVARQYMTYKSLKNRKRRIWICYDLRKFIEDSGFKFITVWIEE